MTQRLQTPTSDEIGRTFDGQVRAVLPLYDSDIRGVPMLDKAAGALFR
jgi:hypothetical protein